MHIVIVGAGDIGSYIAYIMSKEDNDITLVDINQNKLDYASRNMDIATHHGSGTDWQLLEELLELSPALLIALTDDDETNLVICTMAKNLGYAQTMARVRSPKYFNQTRLDFNRLFSVDHFIGPEILAAHDMFNCMTSEGSLHTKSFALGAVCMRTIRIPQRWRKNSTRLAELDLPEGIMIGLIKRFSGKNKFETIFPHGNDVITAGDEVTFIGETEAINSLYQYLGYDQTPMKSIIIIGGSLIGLTLARIALHHNIDVRLIESDYNRCCEISEMLPGCTVLHHIETDPNFLESEKVNKVDFFVACTNKDEVNLLSAILAKKAGCGKIAVSINSTQYADVVEDLELSFTISPRTSAANHILSVIRADAVSSMVSLYDNSAEIMEIKVPLDSKIAGIPLSVLGPLLPRNFLIAVIQNRGRIIVANGDRILCPGDTIIAISSPEHISELNKIF